MSKMTYLTNQINYEQKRVRFFKCKSHKNVFQKASRLAIRFNYLKCKNTLFSIHDLQKVEKNVQNTKHISSLCVKCLYSKMKKIKERHIEVNKTQSRLSSQTWEIEMFL